MQKLFFLVSSLFFLACKDEPAGTLLSHKTSTASPEVKEVPDQNSWPYFLQHLPETKGLVLDYRGNPVPDQQKHASLIAYDVGTSDLQQCADALMRLRAEYLFGQKRYSEIHFHFVSGQDYSYLDYCNGKRPVASGNNVRWTNGAATAVNHQSLRNYLDFVYAYASTISLAKELKNADSFAIGTVIIHPGSPGHCFIIVDEAKTPSGDKLFKLVEGYTPAQSIYVLQNLSEPQLGVWHRLSKGEINTASYSFSSYQLKTFE